MGRAPWIRYPRKIYFSLGYCLKYSEPVFHWLLEPSLVACRHRDWYDDNSGTAASLMDKHIGIITRPEMISIKSIEGWFRARKNARLYRLWALITSDNKYCKIIYIIYIMRFLLKYLYIICYTINTLFLSWNKISISR